MRVVREERFRTPLTVERSLGLWVDRIGFVRGDMDKPERYRLLGQFAALAVETGDGVLEIVGRPPVALNAGDVFLLFPNVPARYGPLKRWDTFWVVWNGPAAIMTIDLELLSVPPHGTP